MLANVSQQRTPAPPLGPHAPGGPSGRLRAAPPARRGGHGAVWQRGEGDKNPSSRRHGGGRLRVGGIEGKKLPLVFPILVLKTATRWSLCTPVGLSPPYTLGRVLPLSPDNHRRSSFASFMLTDIRYRIGGNPILAKSLYQLLIFQMRTKINNPSKI